ncbi:hypothetical protein AQ1_01833 [alpha proteobacterium Q-1]|nr:hypothetical protein AQ1_01833 [alpha proteobacterium Q-1]
MGDLARRLAGCIVGEDAAHYRSFRRIDLTLAAFRLTVGAGPAHDAIAVRIPASRLAVFDPAAQASARLVGEVLEIQRPHRALEADMELTDVAFGERHHAHPGEGEAFVDAGDILLIAGDAVERFGEHNIEAPGLRVLQKRLDTWPDQARA